MVANTPVMPPPSETIDNPVGMSLDEFLIQNTQRPFDLINGEKVYLMPTVSGHDEIQKRFFIRLYETIEKSGAGMVYTEQTFILDASRPKWVKGSRTPDVMVYLGDRVAQYKNANPDWSEKPYALIPDIVIEVLSATDVMKEVEDKIEAYLADGVQEVCLVVYWKRLIRVYTSDVEHFRVIEASEVFTSDLLRGFALPLTDLFNLTP